MKKLGIFIIRGSGSRKFTAQEKWVNKLNKGLSKRGVDTDLISYKFCDWYWPLEKEQETLIKKMKELEGLNVGPIRKFLLTNISDLINYGGRPNLSVASYEEIHRRVHQDLQLLQEDLVTNAPLIIVASSMGTEIINNHIWDRQKIESLPGVESRAFDQFGLTPFERIETLFGLFTLGHNLPIFASAYPVDELQPIRFPGNAISEELLKRSKWENIFDKNDPFGYPIRFINDFYDHSSVEDIQMNVGGLIYSWNFTSHLRYWQSSKIRKRVEDFIATHWDAILADTERFPPEMT